MLCERKDSSLMLYLSNHLGMRISSHILACSTNLVRWCFTVRWKYCSSEQWPLNSLRSGSHFYRSGSGVVDGNSFIVKIKSQKILFERTNNSTKVILNKWLRLGELLKPILDIYSTKLLLTYLKIRLNGLVIHYVDDDILRNIRRNIT